MTMFPMLPFPLFRRETKGTEHTTRSETPKPVLDVRVTGRLHIEGLAEMHVKRIEKDRVLVQAAGDSEPVWMHKHDVLKIVINADVEVPS